MKLMSAIITMFFLSAGIAHAQQASTTLQSYKAPPSQQELDTMANNGWNLISVVPVVANGVSQYYVAYFDNLPPRASKGVNCTYTRNGVLHSEWFSGNGPTDQDKKYKRDLICR